MEPAVSLSLLPPCVFLLSSPLYLSSCNSLKAKIDTFILGLNMLEADILQQSSVSSNVPIICKF